jgi:hypothetical protein
MGKNGYVYGTTDNRERGRVELVEDLASSRQPSGYDDLNVGAAYLMLYDNTAKLCYRRVTKYCCSS